MSGAICGCAGRSRPEGDPDPILASHRRAQHHGIGFHLLKASSLIVFSPFSSSPSSYNYAILPQFLRYCYKWSQLRELQRDSSRWLVFFSKSCY